MFEFNPDGSIKLPEKFAKAKQDNEEKLVKQRCIQIKREVISFTAPKKCKLCITISKSFPDDRFIDTIYKYFKENSSVPSKITKISEREFEVEIGTDFKRCTDCNSLVGRYREFVDGNLIDIKGSCTFQGRTNFCYEDYF